MNLRAPPTTTLTVDVQGDVIRHPRVLAGSTNLDYVQHSRSILRAVFQVRSFVCQRSWMGGLLDNVKTKYEQS